MADASNLFHYYRLTSDNRLLWGGYDVVYHFRGVVRSELDQRPTTFATLAEHFFHTFPQLADLRFSHRWGGVIDACSRFSAFYGTVAGGAIGYALGYSGLGVAATRFGAAVMLDLLDGLATERTGCAWSGIRRCRSRRNRCAGSAPNSQLGQWPARTRTAASAICGCERWTPRASASKPDPTPERASADVSSTTLAHAPQPRCGRPLRSDFTMPEPVVPACYQ